MNVWSREDRLSVDAWCDVIGCEWRADSTATVRTIRGQARNHMLLEGHVTHVRTIEISDYIRG